MATKQKFGQIAPQKPRWVDVDPSQYEWVDLAASAAPAASNEPEQPQARGMLRGVADTGLEVVSGAAKGIKFMSDAFGADNAVSGALDDVSKYVKGLQSAQAQGEDKRMAQIMKEAEDKGIWEQVKAGLSAASEAPVRQTIGALATGIPQIAATMVPGLREASWGTRMATLSGLGAVQGAGMAKSSMHDAVYQRAIEEDRSPEEAAALAQQAQAYTGDNAGQIALGAGLNAAASGTGFAPALLKTLGKRAATDAAQDLAMPTMGKALGMGVVKEVPLEATQGGQEQLAGNVAQSNAGFETPLGRGVAGSATMEGALSMGGGLVGGAMDYRNDAADYRAQEAATQAKAEADAAKTQADTIRATKPQGDGPLSKAVGAGIEAEAQKVESAPVLGARLGTTPMADMLGGAGMAGGGLTGNADPIANMIAGVRESDATSEINIRNFAQNRAPMVASDAARILDEAKTRGLDFTAAPHPEGGFMVVPRQWVTPGVGQSAETEIADTLTRMAQVDAAPVERAPRARADAVDLTLPTADPVRDYVDGMRKVNTPAAKFYVSEFDAGRITPVDVQQRIQAERGKTPDERLADAAAQAPKNTAQPGDILNPSGQPFKTLMSARLAAQKTPGDVIEVVGGYSVRPRTEVTNAQAAPVPASQPQADAGAVQAPVKKEAQPQTMRIVVRRDITGDEFEVQGSGANGSWEKQTTFRTADAANDFLKSLGHDVGTIETLVSEWSPKSKRFSPPKRQEPTTPAQAEPVAAAVAGQPEQAQPLSPADSRKLQEAHKALGYGVTQPQVQSMRDRVAAEVETGTTNNGGVVVALKPAAIKERREQLQRLDADLALFGNAPTAQTMQQPTQQQKAQPLSDAKPVATEATPASGIDQKDNKDQQAYQLPESVHKDWPRAEWSDFEPSPRQQVVMDAVASALDEGKYYTDDVRERASELLGVSPDVLARNKSNVEGGDFGFDVYYARKAVEAQRANNKSRQLADEMALKPGDVLGTLVANDYKRMTGVKVVSISDSGLSAVIEAKRGTATVRGEMGVDALKAAFDRANERGNRKDTYADFVKSRSKPSKPDMGNPTSAQTDAGNPATPPVAEIPATTSANDSGLPDGWKELRNGFNNRPVYRLDQDGGKPFAVVQRNGINDFSVEIRQGDKRLSQVDVVKSKADALAFAKSKLDEASGVATHKDPGEKPEAATPAVVAESLKTAAKNEDVKPSDMKKWLLGELDKAMLAAPDRNDYDDTVKGFGAADALKMWTGNGRFGKDTHTGFLNFDVPGDGKFKVRNGMRGLLEFRQNVERSKGFSNTGARTAAPERNNGVQGGSGGQMSAITNMIEEGDFEAARDYADAVGISLADVKVPRGDRKPQWDAFMKDGTLPLPPDTKPLPPQKTAAQLEEEKRQAAETEAKKPKDTGWNMAGTGYGGKRYIGRNIKLDDGREIVARVYENAGTYEEAEVRVDGARKFAVTDRYNAQDKADAFIRTLTAKTSEATQSTEQDAQPAEKPATPQGIAGQTFDQWVKDSYQSNEYKDRYLAKFGDEKKAMLGSVIGSTDSDMRPADMLKEAKLRYFKKLLDLPRETGIALEVWDGLNDGQKVEAQRHFYDLEARIVRRTQDESAAKAKAKSNANAEADAPAGRTYLAVPFADKDNAKQYGAKWDADKNLWFADPLQDGEINLNLQKFIPRDSTADDRYNYYSTKDVAQVVAINASARDGIEYEVKKRTHPDGIAMWSVMKPGAAEAVSPAAPAPQPAAEPATATPKLTQAENTAQPSEVDLNPPIQIKTGTKTLKISDPKSVLAKMDAKIDRLQRLLDCLR